MRWAEHSWLRSARNPRITCVVLVEEADLLSHQDPVEVVPDPQVQPGEGQREDSAPHPHRHGAAQEEEISRWRVSLPRTRGCQGSGPEAIRAPPLWPPGPRPSPTWPWLALLA